MSKIRKLSDLMRERSRGTISPWLVRATRQANYNINHTLVVAGYPRSGTTWLAEIVARSPGSGLIFEPLDFRSVPAARAAGCNRNNFRLADDDWPEGQEFLGAVLSGRVLNAWTTSHLPLAQAVQVSRWVVKFVRANQMLAWLVRHFDIPPPVFLIRHPCAVFASWVSRGWPVIDYPVRTDLRFFDHYPQYKDVVKGLSHPEEHFAALWSIQHRKALDDLSSISHYLCYYEHLIQNGLDELSAICSHWNLALPDNVEQVLFKPSGKASESLRAGSGAQLSQWQLQLAPEVIRRILAVVHRFHLDVYDEGPMPSGASTSTPIT